ncbi:MAG TPA: IS5 family transposase [Flavobacterium sp.]|nr:IS5 family transposase [Flavobacterium sp.]
MTETQWNILKPLLPKTRNGMVGRPPQDLRKIVNGILWICKTGAAWNELPQKYVPYQTCHRYFQKWCMSGLWNKILWRIAEDLRDRGKIDLTECFIDGTFATAKKGALVFGKTKKGKGTKIMAIADASGIPVSIWVGAANTHECKLVEKTIDAKFVKGRPQKLIGDMAYDSDPLDARLRKRKIKMIAPHKRNRKKKATQDGRTLRKYKRRWKIERFFAWLQNQRRCTTRYDFHVENFLGFVQLACIKILIKQF